MIQRRSSRGRLGRSRRLSRYFTVLANDCAGFTRSLHEARDSARYGVEHTGSSGPDNGPGPPAHPLVVEGSRLANPVPATPGGKPGALGAYFRSLLPDGYERT